MNARWLASFLALVCLAPYALASEGPFMGAVTQGESDLHAYDNNPNGDPCITVMAVYTVELSYSPASDTLTLAAGGETDAGSNGDASVTFWASYCTAFTISVTGTSVASLAKYAVKVTRDDGFVVDG